MNRGRRRRVGRVGAMACLSRHFCLFAAESCKKVFGLCEDKGSEMGDKPGASISRHLNQFQTGATRRGETHFDAVRVTSCCSDHSSRSREKSLLTRLPTAIIKNVFFPSRHRSFSAGNLLSENGRVTLQNCRRGRRK